MKKEIWRDIPNYEGYQVSNLGNLKSLDRFVNHGRIGKIKIKGVDMVLLPNTSG